MRVKLYCVFLGNVNVFLYVRGFFDEEKYIKLKNGVRGECSLRIFCNVID